MSKFLKFIVHFFVICTIVCVLGLALPPFFGVRTVIMDSSDKATNLPVGSVTYAIPVKTEDVAAGTPILVQEDGKSYRYNLVSVNRENNTGTVIDTTTSAQQNITVSVKNWVPKIVVTIPFVGYLLVATESIEGLIILGLVILFLIILYVIAELWKKEPEDEYEDLQGDTRHVKTSKELKMEEKARARKMKEEDNELLYGEKEKKKRAKKEEKIKRKKIRTGGFVDEIYEDDLDEEAQEQEPTVRPTQNVQAATSEAHELLKKEPQMTARNFRMTTLMHRATLLREFRFSKAILLKQNRRMRKKRLKSRNLRFQDAQQLNWQIKRVRQEILLIS